MSRKRITARDVKQARTLVWQGWSVKAVAEVIGTAYGPTWCAIRGKTWSSIQQPPPVPGNLLQQRRRRQARTCQNCQKTYRKGGTRQYCNACYLYLFRHGRQRTPANLGKQQRTHITTEQLQRLYRQYQAGLSVEKVARSLAVSTETLRRKFNRAGYAMRSSTFTKQQLHPGLVRQIRILANRDRIPITEIARRVNLNYQTVYDAASGRTWKQIGGPLPKLPKQPQQECAGCGLLTAHPSGRCRYCRSKT